MDGDGWMEIAVGWQMSSDIQMLSVYSLKGFVASAIATADYTEYTSAEYGRGRDNRASCDTS